MGTISHREGSQGRLPVETAGVNTSEFTGTGAMDTGAHKWNKASSAKKEVIQVTCAIIVSCRLHKNTEDAMGEHLWNALETTRSLWWGASLWAWMPLVTVWVLLSPQERENKVHLYPSTPNTMTPPSRDIVFPELGIPSHPGPHLWASDKSQSMRQFAGYDLFQKTSF